MAKKAQHINRFDGGLNDSSSRNKIENNQLPSLNNVQFDKHGLIRQMGQSVKTTENNLDTIASTISPGYGLHQFNTGTTATNASNSLISNVITQQGSDGSAAYAFSPIVDFIDITDAGRVRNNASFTSFTFTFKIGSSDYASADALCSWTVNKSAAATEDFFFLFTNNSLNDATANGYQDSATGNSYSCTTNGETYSHFSVEDFNPGVFNARLADAINAASSGWNASLDIHDGNSFTGLYLYSNSQQTSDNNKKIFMKITNNAGTTPGDIDVDGVLTSVAYYARGANEDNEHAGFQHNFHEEPANNNVPSTENTQGGAAATTHVTRINVGAVDGLIATKFRVGIGCIEGSTTTTQYVEYSASGGTSVNTVATELASLINGDSTIINSDNIANGSGGAANSNFAVASSGNVTLTTDNTGSDGIFTVETSVQSDGIGLQDSENLALVTNTGIFKLIGLGQGVFPSSVFTGTLADDGSIWSDASPKTQFYSVDGFLRFYDIDFEHTNNVNKVFGSINKTGLWNGTGGSTLSIQKNVIENQDISWDFTFDTDAKGIRLAAETAVNATPAAKKMEIRIETDGTGTWGGAGAEKYAFYATAVYDDDSETLPEHQFTFNGGSDKYLSFNQQKLKMTVHATPGAVDAEANYIAKFRVKEFNIYWSSEKDGYGEKNLLATINFKNGLEREDGGETLGWIQSSGAGVKISDGSNAFALFENPIEINTFQTRNLYDWKVESIVAKYKTATVTNRRAFIGNVKIGNEIFNDLIIYTPTNQFDVFPYPDNIIETTTSDGSAIKALMSTGDRLFEYKDDILYIHNIAGGSPDTWFLEAVHPYLGCSGQNKIIKVNNGLFWINNISAYYFSGDPENIQDLRFFEKDKTSTERIKLSTWQGIVNSNSLVGYDIKSHTAIIKSSCNATAKSGNILQYSFENDAWGVGNGKWVHNRKSSNFINLNDGTLLNAYEGSLANTVIGQHTDGENKV